MSSKVVFERFARLLSIQSTSVIEINPETKDPINRTVKIKKEPPNT